MSSDAGVYDLGEVGPRAHRPATTTTPTESATSAPPVSTGAPAAAITARPPALGKRSMRTAPAPAPRPAGVSKRPRPLRAAPVAPPHLPLGPSRAAVSLALVVPGASHLLRGRWSAGLAYASSAAPLAAVGWSTLATAGRLAETLPLLGAPPAAAFWLLEAVFVALVLVHLSSLHAASRPTVRYPGRLPRVVPVAASMLVPGWGQLLRGKRLRALAFFAGLWASAAVWLALTPAAAQLMAELDLFLPEPLLLFVLPIARIAAPLIVWLMAVYDAAVAEDW